MIADVREARRLACASMQDMTLDLLRPAELLIGGAVRGRRPPEEATLRFRSERLAIPSGRGRGIRTGGSRKR